MLTLDTGDFARTVAKPALRLVYVLKSSATIKVDAPLHRDFERDVRAEIASAFPHRMAEAMRSRRTRRCVKR